MLEETKLLELSFNIVINGVEEEVKSIINDIKSEDFSKIVYNSANWEIKGPEFNVKIDNEGTKICTEDDVPFMACFNVIGLHLCEYPNVDTRIVNFLCPLDKEVISKGKLRLLSDEENFKWILLNYMQMLKSNEKQNNGMVVLINNSLELKKKRRLLRNNRKKKTKSEELCFSALHQVEKIMNEDLKTKHEIEQDISNSIRDLYYSPTKQIFDYSKERKKLQLKSFTEEF
jgi:hypothetical protein